jgi:hypothetical protein
MSFPISNDSFQHLRNIDKQSRQAIYIKFIQNLTRLRDLQKLAVHPTNFDSVCNETEIWVLDQRAYHLIYSHDLGQLLLCLVQEAFKRNAIPRIVKIFESIFRFKEHFNSALRRFLDLLYSTLYTRYMAGQVGLNLREYIFQLKTISEDMLLRLHSEIFPNDINRNSLVQVQRINENVALFNHPCEIVNSEILFRMLCRKLVPTFELHKGATLVQLHFGLDDKITKLFEKNTTDFSYNVILRAYRNGDSGQKHEWPTSLENLRVNTSLIALRKRTYTRSPANMIRTIGDHIPSPVTRELKSGINMLELKLNNITQKDTFKFDLELFAELTKEEAREAIIALPKYLKSDFFRIGIDQIMFS